MTIDIQSLIEQRPHLEDPLALYARWQRFQRAARELLSRVGAADSPEDSRAYPREIAGEVMHSFVSIFKLSAEELDPLRRALEAGEIDFMRLTLGDVPEVKLPYDRDELETILFLLSRPWLLVLRDAGSLEDNRWEDGRCPFCSARPALASIQEGPQRVLHCSCCGTVGPYRFIGCPGCGTVDTNRLSILESEEEPGFRVSVCDACGTYVKTVEANLLKEMTPDQADLASLPLDIVAQEKGYARQAPNPIGLKKMV
jgi:FdhE protein